MRTSPDSVQNRDAVAAFPPSYEKHRMPTRSATWLHRIVLGVLLVVAYQFLWTPARTVWIQAVATPLFERVAGSDQEIRAHPESHRVQVEEQGGEKVGYVAPVGVKFLLSAGFLIFLVPHRPPIVFFFFGHLVLGGLILVLFQMGIASIPAAGPIAEFLQTYGVNAYSLGLPVLFYAQASTSEAFYYA